MRTLLIFQLIVGCLSLLVGCSSASRSKVQADTSLPTHLAWLERLKDNQTMLSDSEFTIVFPTENYPGVRSLSVLAKGGRHIIGWAHSSRRSLREAKLSAEQYVELVQLLRGLRFNEFGDEDTARCDSYTLKIRIEQSEASFQGCRKAGANASVVSRVAHQTQFFVLSGARP